MEIKTEAIVLQSIDYKDNDKLLTLFSPSLGKLTAGIRGVKKPTAKLSFAAQPFCFAEYVLAEKGGDTR
jgi:DNA repair protein RecO (recombination protein O)